MKRFHMFCVNYNIIQTFPLSKGSPPRITILEAIPSVTAGVHQPRQSCALGSRIVGIFLDSFGWEKLPFPVQPSCQPSLGRCSSRQPHQSPKWSSFTLKYPSAISLGQVQMSLSVEWTHPSVQLPPPWSTSRCVGTPRVHFFTDTSRKALSKQRFVKQIRDILNSLGLQQDQYAGHSFRIGAATTAAAVGIQDSTIQTLGRWHSAVFLQYICTPKEQLASLSSRLASSLPTDHTS